MTSDLYELFDHAAGWRLPVRVKWTNSALAEVTFADVPLLNLQRRSMEDTLSAAATHCAQIDGRWVWYISIRGLERVAVKSSAADPETVVRWSPPAPDAEVQADFINAYCASRVAVISNPEVFAPIWASIQTFALRWIVTEGRALDLGFGRLDAFPLRANWKNAILGRICENRKYQRHYSARNFEFFHRCLTQNAELLTAYDTKTHTMRWSVEFTPNERFHETTDLTEGDRKKNHRWKFNYLGQICAALKEDQLHDRLYENLIAYAKETDFPFAIFPDGSGPRNPPKGQQPTRSTTEWYDVALVTIAAAAGHEGSAVVPEDASLLSMQHLRPPAEDVRQRDDVDGAGSN